MFVGAVLSILVGLFAIVAPTLFSYVITAFIGALCLVSGFLGLFQSIFSKEIAHRILSGLSAVIRIAAGSALFFFTESGLETLTLIIGAVFLVEGVFCIVTSFRMRANAGWIWLCLNGVAALVLGVMVYARWPLDSEWVIGLLYGVQSIFSGTAMLMIAFAADKKS